MANVLRFPDRIPARNPAGAATRPVQAAIVILPCIRREALTAKR